VEGLWSPAIFRGLKTAILRQMRVTLSPGDSDFKIECGSSCFSEASKQRFKTDAGQPVISNRLVIGNSAPLEPRLQSK
jgi:hypothetical protein